MFYCILIILQDKHYLSIQAGESKAARCDAAHITASYAAVYRNWPVLTTLVLRTPGCRGTFDIIFDRQTTKCYTM